MAGSNTRNVNVAFSVTGGDSSRQEVNKVRKAVEDFGEGGKASAQKLIAPLENIEREFDKVESKISHGRAVTVKDVAAMGQQFDLLQREIEKAFGSLDHAPVEMQAAYRKAEAQLDSTKKKVRELTDAVQDQKGELREGGEHWAGFGAGMEKVAGKYGKLVAGAGLFAAALKEGWNIGMQFNKFVGTDMTLFEESIARVGQKFNLIVRNMAELAVAEFNLVMGAVHLNKAEVINAAKDIKDGVAKQFVDLAAVATKTGNEWDAYAKKAGVATKANAEAEGAARALREEKEKLRKEIEDTTKAIAAETAELDKQVKSAQESKKQIDDNTAAAYSLSVALEWATTKLEHQKNVLAELTKIYGENDPATKQAAEQMHRLQVQVDELQKRYEGATAAVAKYKEQNDAATASVNEHGQQIAELRKGHDNLQQAVAKAAATVAAATTTTEGAATAAESAQKQVRAWRDEQGKFHVSNQETAESTQKVADSADKVAGSVVAANGAVRALRDEQGHITISNQAPATSADKAATATNTLATAQQAATPAAQGAATAAGQLADAAGKAAPAIAATATQLDSALTTFKGIDSTLTDINSQLRTMIDLLPQMAKASKDAAEAA